VKKKMAKKAGSMTGQPRMSGGMMMSNAKGTKKKAKKRKK
jgi:hypothetical protein